MLLVNKQNLQIASDLRLVEVEEVATVRTAEEIIATAEAEAARIREEAKAAFEEEKKKGYEKGLADGKLEISMQKLELVDSSVAFMESVEQKMEDRYRETIDEYYNYTGEFPDGKHRKEADKIHEKAQKFINHIESKRTN